jgi:hypothetical protein
MALCAIHNFICMHDPDEGVLPVSNQLILLEDHSGDSSAVQPDNLEDEGGGSARRDQIAEWMWEDYQQVLAERGISNENEDLEDFGFDSDDESL